MNTLSLLQTVDLWINNYLLREVHKHLKLCSLYILSKQSISGLLDSEKGGLTANSQQFYRFHLKTFLQMTYF